MPFKLQKVALKGWRVILSTDATSCAVKSDNRNDDPCQDVHCAELVLDENGHSKSGSCKVKESRFQSDIPQMRIRCAIVTLSIRMHERARLKLYDSV